MSTKLGYFLFEHLVTLAWVPPNDALFWSLDVNLPSYEPPIDYKICYPGLFVVLIFFLFKQFYKTNTVDFRRIQTGVVRVEGEQTDLLDATTTALRHGKGGFKQTEDSGSFLLTTFLRFTLKLSKCFFIHRRCGLKMISFVGGREPVWPDWSIFEMPWHQIVMRKSSSNIG